VLRDPEFSKAETNTPYLRLLMQCDPWGERDPHLSIPLKEVREIMENAGCEGIPNIPFEAIHTTADGIVARQIGDNNPQDLGLTWYLRKDLSGELIVPLALIEPGDVSRVKLELHGYLYAEEFELLLEKSGFTSPRIVDLNKLFNVLIGVLGKQQRLLSKAGWDKSYYVKARLLNVRRIVPFVDTSFVIEEFTKNGIPVCLGNKITMPMGTDPWSFRETFELDDNTHQALPIIARALLIFEDIAHALGFSPMAKSDFKAENRNVYSDLTDAGERAMFAQNLRIDRTRN
jgi:hypothetical protein